MSTQKHPPLGETGSDVAARTISALAGAIPCVGPILQITINETIKNVRLDRIETFLLYLQDRIDENNLKHSLNTPDGLDIFEEGISQSARALSEERKQYIADLVSNGMKASGVEKQQIRHFLRILTQIDDAQIIILCSYQSKYRRIGDINSDNFFNKHKDVLGPFSREIGRANDDIDKAQLKDALEHHLSSFGLLMEDKSSRQPTQIAYKITPQGIRFIKFIGLSDPE